MDQNDLETLRRLLPAGDADDPELRRLCAALLGRGKSEAATMARQSNAAKASQAAAIARAKRREHQPNDGVMVTTPDRKLKSNCATCLNCGYTVWSKHDHDFATCKCGNLSVDGGLSYLRRVHKGDYQEMSEYEEEITDNAK